MAREIKGGSNLGSPGRFWKALFFHHRFTEKPELYTTECMNTVVDTMVVRDIASGHSVVGGIDNGVTFQGGNVPLPQIEADLQDPLHLFLLFFLEDRHPESSRIPHPPGGVVVH